MDENQIKDVKEYVDQFYVLGKKSNINCDFISKLLYQTILNKFNITFDQLEYAYFKEYQERVFDLIENLREFNTPTIKLVFDYIVKQDEYLTDNIIMLWSMPRSDKYLSTRMYDAAYQENIKKYSSKLVEMIDHEVMKNFCIETLTKTNYVPVHCIDFLWYYMNDLSFDFVFTNSKSGSYIGFVLDHSSDFTELIFNMEYLLRVGLGNVVYSNNPIAKGSFGSFLKNFVVNIDVIKTIMGGHSKKNYFVQLCNINKNMERYFGEKIEPLSKDTLEEIKKMLN